MSITFSLLEAIHGIYGITATKSIYNPLKDKVGKKPMEYLGKTPDICSESENIAIHDKDVSCVNVDHTEWKGKFLSVAVANVASINSIPAFIRCV